MMNERSSRAHSLLLLTVTQQQQQSGVNNNNSNSGGGGAVTAPGEPDTAAPVVVSQLCLADLGGSEKVKRSGASGERLHEAIFINKGLLALKSVVSTSARSKRHPGGATARHGSPRLATWPPWAWLPRLLAARRTRDEPLSRPGPNGLPRCGRKARPTSPVLRRPTRRRAQPEAQPCPLQGRPAHDVAAPFTLGRRTDVRAARCAPRRRARDRDTAGAST